MTRADLPRVLLLEDSDIDAELLELRLHEGELPAQLLRVSHRQEYLRELARGPHDLVLADYALPDFRGLEALEILRARWPDVPLIYVSGVVGEEFATNALRAGAADYVLKTNLGRLVPAMRRVLAESQERGRRHRAEAELRQVAIRFRMAVEAAGLGVWDLPADGAELELDDAGRRILEAGEATRLSYAQTFLPAVHVDDRPRLRGAIERTLASEQGPDLNVEFRWHALQSGRPRWLAARGRRIAESGGGVRLAGTLRDVTEERRKDQALQQANLDLEQRVAERTRERDQLWNLSPDLMLSARVDGRIASANPAWASMLGYGDGEVLESYFTDLLHPEDVGVVGQALQSLCAERPIARFDARLRRRDGGHRWIRWTCSGTDGGAWNAIGRDVTDERQAADELFAANTALRAQIEERARVEATLNQMQRLEAVGQLTAGVAHDFNNMLQVVQANTALVGVLLKRHGARLPDVSKRLAAIDDAARRSATLTSQLLAFSRRQRLEPQPVDLNEAVAGMRDLLQSTLGGTVKLQTRLDQRVGRALVDPTQLELIVLNLAINARDAMNVGGTLTVATGQVRRTDPPTRPGEPEPGDYVVVSVADTGTGMSDAVLAKAFEPFFTTKEVGKGSGLGLAQVFGFAKQSGGGVAITTALGVGTTVEVFLPQAPADVAPDEVRDEAGGSADDGPRTLRRRVLVVDDNPAVRDVTVAMLQNLGCQVFQADGGTAALQMLADHADVDVLVADFAMPGMNGADLALAARALRPALAVLLVTGFVDLSALGDVDPDWLLPKPFTESQLRRKLLQAA
jgi:PAS domain S-box-containing protein